MLVISATEGEFNESLVEKEFTRLLTLLLLFCSLCSQLIVQYNCLHWNTLLKVTKKDLVYFRFLQLYTNIKN